MRELKFRAWNNVTKGMISDVQDELLIGAVSSIPDLFLMQYTGLKDKNGVEIYEGDIVQRKNWHENSDGKTVLSEANSYMKKWAVIYEIGSVWQGYTVDSKDEVIGNIYQNPELLK